MWIYSIQLKVSTWLKSIHPIIIIVGGGKTL